MKNLTRVMEGTMDQYLRQKKKLREKKFFRILRKKYGSEDIGDGQKCTITILLRPRIYGITSSWY